MATALTIIHILACIFLILVVLLQSGKGAEVSASFGGSSQTIFGTSGGTNILVKATWVVVGIFALTSILLTVGGTPKSAVEEEILNSIPTTTEKTQAPIESAPAPKAPVEPAPESPAH